MSMTNNQLCTSIKHVWALMACVHMQKALFLSLSFDFS